MARAPKTPKAETPAPAPAEPKRVRWPHHVSRSLAPVIAPAVSAFGLASGDIVLKWPTIVGPDLARFTRPERLSGAGKDGKGGTLVLRVVGAAALEIEHQSPAIIERINAFYGFAAVGRLKLVHGLATKRPPRVSASPVSPSAVSRGEAAVRAVVDPELRDILARIGAHVFSQSKD